MFPRRILTSSTMHHSKSTPSDAAILFSSLKESFDIYGCLLHESCIILYRYITNLRLDMKDKLIEVRKNARRMHESYLRSNGLFTYIMESTSGEGFEKWNIRNRIDFLIEESSPVKCYCGDPHYVKPGKQVCSQRCAANEPSTVVRISEIQRNNKVERAAKARKTYQEKYGVTWNNQLPGVRESKKKKRDLKKIETLKKRFSELGLDSDSFFDKEYLSTIRDQCKSLGNLVKNISIEHTLSLFRNIMHIII